MEGESLVENSREPSDVSQVAHETNKSEELAPTLSEAAASQCDEEQFEKERSNFKILTWSSLSFSSIYIPTFPWSLYKLTAQINMQLPLFNKVLDLERHYVELKKEEETELREFQRWYSSLGEDFNEIVKDVEKVSRGY